MTFKKPPEGYPKEIHIRLDWELASWLYDRAIREGFMVLNKYITNILTRWRLGEPKRKEMERKRLNNAKIRRD